MAKEQTNIRERTTGKTKEPRRFKVIIYNDDFTTMEFVVELLVGVFQKDRSEALALTLKVHHTGQAVVGIYTYDVAASKVDKAQRQARAQGFPLRLSYEPE